MIKLVEQFGTKYFASHYAGEVRQFLDTVKEAVDLADARICREVMKHVMSAAYNGVMIHDTLDKEREEYFAENRRRRELQKNQAAPTLLPIPTNVGEVVPLIKSLSAEKLYTVPDGKRVVDKAFVFLSQAARPEIQIDLGSYVGDVLAFVYDNLFPSSFKWEEFYVLIGSTFIISKPVAGEYNSFINSNCCVPTVFGQRCLFQLPEWERCIARISKAMDKNMKPKNRKIRDYL